jgi:hypothetical protein
MLTGNPATQAIPAIMLGCTGSHLSTHGRAAFLQHTSLHYTAHVTQHDQTLDNILTSRARSTNFLTP